VIPSAPRQWDFDIYPDTPAESIFSTSPPPEVWPVPRQIELPPKVTGQMAGDG
jgi:hypothetical protein